MTAIFPGDIKSFTPVIDNFDVVEAANINPVYEEITSIETWLERALPLGYHSHTETMTTDVTFTDTDFPIQYLDPTTDGFVVNLPSTTDANHIYYICNSSTSTALSIYSGTDEVTQIAAEKSATLISNGTTWAALTGGDPIVYSASVLDVTDTDTAGSSDSVARGDHRHKLAVTAPVYFDGGNLKLRYGTGLTVTSGSLVATGGSTDTGTGGIGQNFIINGDFRIHQRQNSGNLADDTYCRDRWVLLSSTNSSYSISGTTGAAEMSTDSQFVFPDGIGHYALLIRASGYANEQAGLFQVIENINTRPLLNTDVSLSFWAKKYSATDNYIDNLKAVVLAWSSTSSSDIDAVTSDCVATWGNTLTYATGWTAENTPSDLNLTTDWQNFKIESIAVDTELTHNLGVLIYISDTDTPSSNNNGVYITGVKLELGTAATSFVPRLYSDELELCKRYYERMYYPVAYYVFGPGFSQSTTVFKALIYFTEKRTAGTMATSGSTDFLVLEGSGDKACSNVATAVMGAKWAQVNATTTGLTVGQAGVLRGWNSIVPYMTIDAEL